MNNADIRIGIVGAGQNTKQKHIPGFQAIDNVEIISVCNRSSASSQRAADQFGIPNVYEHWRELVEADDTNAIVIGTWPYMHCEVTLAALAAGKHVLCEARMARNVEEALKMLNAARQRPELVAQVVPSPMTLEFDKTIRKMIEEGYVGELLAVDLKAESQFVDDEGPMHWRYDFELSGYNTMSLGIWYEALMGWIGPAVKVTAMSKIFVTDRVDRNNVKHKIEIPDHLDVIAEMACGAQANMRFSSVTGLSDGPKVFLFGTKGTLCLACDKLYAGTRNDNALKEVIIEPYLQGSWRVEQEFVNAIRGIEKVKLTTFEDGLKYMKFTEAVIKSAQTGKAIEFN